MPHRGNMSAACGVLHSLPKVERFAMRSFQATEEYRLPIDHIQPFSELVNLTCLKLSGLNIQGTLLPSLSHLSSLEELHTWKIVGLKWIFEMLAGLSNLRIIKCTDDQMLEGDIRALKSFNKLSRLKLRGCHGVMGPLVGLSELRTLKELELSYCEDITGSLTVLGGLKDLTSLNLVGCTSVTGSLSSLGELKNLSNLELSDCSNVTGSLSALGKLQRLVDLDLSACPLVAGSVLDLRGFARLKNVWLDGTRVMTADVQDIKRDDYPTLTREEAYALVTALMTRP